MKTKLIKKNGALYPFDEESKLSIDKLPLDTFLYLETRRPRNNGHHRKYFAMLNIIKANFPDTTLCAPSIDILHEGVKEKLGMWKIAFLGDMVMKIYDTISFEKMDQEEFEAFYDKAVQVCLDWVPVDDAVLAEKVANFAF